MYNLTYVYPIFHPGSKEELQSTSSDTRGWFECPGCKKCTFEKYFLKEECPKKPKSEDLSLLCPYLNVNHLSEFDKEDFVKKLKINLRDIHNKFVNYSIQLRESLETQNISLDSVKQRIFGLKACPGVNVVSKNELELELATSLSEVFNILLRNKYISFFDYEILKEIIEYHGSDEDKRLHEEYLGCLLEFCKKSLFEVPISVFSSIANYEPKSQPFIIKCIDLDESTTLQMTFNLIQLVADVFELRPHVFQLCSIEKGCVELHFLISTAVADHIFPVSPSQHSKLSAIGVRVLYPSSESK